MSHKIHIHMFVYGESTSRVHASLPKHCSRIHHSQAICRGKWWHAARAMLLPKAAINQLEDGELAGTPPLSRLLVSSVSISVDRCQSQRESMKKIPKNPIIPLLWLEAVWMIGDVELERLVEAGWLLASPNHRHSVPDCATPVCLRLWSLTDSLCCLYLGQLLQLCHRLLSFRLCPAPF